jgi:predicted ATP-dependent protease
MSHQLQAKQLNISLKATDLAFKSTDEIIQSIDVNTSRAWVGQAEAKKATEFGLSIFKNGFNVLVLGESGSGRQSLVWDTVKSIMQTRPQAPDLVLLYRFDAPEKPLPLYLKAGQGKQLRAAMDSFIRFMLKEFPPLLAESAAEKKDTGAAKLEIEKIIDAQCINLVEMLMGQDTEQAHSPVLKQFAHYLSALKRDAMENIELFQQATSANSDEGLIESFLARYRVNLMVDNSHSNQAAPAIYDEDPTFSSLFGGFESADSGSSTADFMRLKAGNVLRANGGTLMMHLRDINADQQSGSQILEKLHRFLRNGSLQIEELSGSAGQNSNSHFAPEALMADVKLVLIATREEYYALQAELPEFARYFQIKVDFVESMPASAGAYQQIAALIARWCAQYDLLHASADAVVSLVRFLQRHIDDQTRISTQFSLLERLLHESAAIAQTRKAKHIEAQDVKAALAARYARHHCPERQLRESIVDGEVMINITGAEVGRINGLTHIDLGDMSFGSPVRISARCYAGDEGVINIDREVAMTGPNHDKGLMILRSWLSATFTKLTPLSLTASLVFEQEYHGVEGDSASCAELYSLLSALSGIPIKQGIAVTGAMNQHGEVMAIGGVNEKIEGYFRICQNIGLDGTQGVIIPSRNLAHLLLDDEVVDAVEKGLFNIYSVSNVAEGIALLTGINAGKLNNGEYETGTVLGAAQQHLEAFKLSYQQNQPIQLISPVH